MSNPYNRHYRQESYFGQPYKGLVDFFEHYTNRNVVIDLGCGQGRDALFLGGIGYRVVGVDISDVGIEQLNKAAKQEKLQVEGVVGDISSFAGKDCN